VPLGSVCKGLHFRHADRAHQDLRIEKTHPDAFGCLIANDHVAGQQQADVRRRLQHLMRQLRIARAEDSVGRHFGAEPIPHRALKIDVTQDAEAFALGRLEGPGQRVIEGDAGECCCESVHGAAFPADPSIDNLTLRLSESSVCSATHSRPAMWQLIWRR